MSSAPAEQNAITTLTVCQNNYRANQGKEKCRDIENVEFLVTKISEFAG